MNINNSISNNLFTKSNFKKLFYYTTFFHYFRPLFGLLLKGDDKKAEPMITGSAVKYSVLAQLDYQFSLR